MSAFLKPSESWDKASTLDESFVLVTIVIPRKGIWKSSGGSLICSDTKTSLEQSDDMWEYDYCGLGNVERLWACLGLFWNV